MKRDFEIFIMPEQKQAFCDFVNALSNRGLKHTVTRWDAHGNEQSGFCVWYYAR
jgi:hypothetical protein